MKDFIIAIAASALGTIIVIVASSMVSRQARWLLTSTLGLALGIDVEYVFANADSAKEDITRELARPAFVDLFTFRGTDLQGDLFGPVLKGSSRAFRVLLPHTDVPSPLPDWIQQRQDEIMVFDPAPAKRALRDQVRFTADFLDHYKREGQVEVRRFTIVPFGRVLITDRVAYFTPYRSDRHARHCAVIKYRTRGHMYDWFKRLFNQLWENEPQTFPQERNKLTSPTVGRSDRARKKITDVSR